MIWENCHSNKCACFSLWLFTYVRIREMAGRRVALYVPLCVASSHTRNIWPKKRWVLATFLFSTYTTGGCHLVILCFVGGFSLCIESSLSFTIQFVLIHSFEPNLVFQVKHLPLWMVAIMVLFQVKINLLSSFQIFISITKKNVNLA